MKKLSVLVIMALAASASAAVVEDFESGWAGSGVLVADPDNAANTVLHLVGGQTALFAQAGPGKITVDVYDFGVTVQDDMGGGTTNGYGPRWGATGDGNGLASITAKSYLNATKGYAMGIEGLTGSWWSAQWHGSPRLVDALQVIGTGDPFNPEIPGDGDWTTWTFWVNTSGSVTISNGVNTKMLSLALNPGGMANIGLSGGKNTLDAMGAAGALYDNVTFDVPEPATMSLLALGGLAMLRRRR